MHSIYLPGADHATQWFGEGNYQMPFVTKMLLHTTETVNWPGYDNGLKAPTLTIHPGKKQIRQHFPINGSARALRDPDNTPVRENRDNVMQIEICWYASQIDKLDDWTYGQLGYIAAFLNTEWELPLVAADNWNTAGDKQRMTSAEYDAFQGILGHMHASGNDHQDPGPIDAQRIISIATQIVTVDQKDDDMFTDQDRARLNHIYGTGIDSDGSPALSTLLGRVLAELDKTNARLDEIESKLAS